MACSLSLFLVFRPIANEYSITERIPPDNRNNIDYNRRLSDTAKTCWLPTKCNRASAKYESVEKIFRTELRVIRLEKSANCFGFLSVLDCDHRSTMKSLGKICFFERWEKCSLNTYLEEREFSALTQSSASIIISIISNILGGIPARNRDNYRSRVIGETIAFCIVMSLRALVL